MKTTRPGSAWMLALVASFSAFGIAAQDQEILKAKREKKLAKEVFKNAPWATDYDAARKQAKKEGKLIVAYFTRSYSP